MKTLILGAGKYATGDEFHTLCDIRPFPNINIVHNLDVTPWPIASHSFDSIIATHLVEHLKSLVDFMNECHRVLSVGGELYIETPLAGGDVDLEFCDPTHVRCYRRHSFINYFTRAGIEKFGYTDKAWAVWECSDDGKVLRFHGQPIK